MLNKVIKAAISEYEKDVSWHSERVAKIEKLLEPELQKQVEPMIPKEKIEETTSKLVGMLVAARSWFREEVVERIIRVLEKI
jgi:hypothetical protein